MSVPTRRHALLGGAAFTLGLGGILLPGSALACHTYVSPVDGRVGCGANSRDRKSTSSGTSGKKTVSKPQTGSRGDGAEPPPGGSSDIPGSTGLWNPVQGINVPALSPTTTHNVSNASQLAAAINTINTTNAAGHHIVLANGSYPGDYTIYAQGTQANPIVIRPANFLGATLTGTLTIAGSWVIVRGLNTRAVNFGTSNGFTANNSRISRCRLSGVASPVQVERLVSYCCFDRNEFIGGQGHIIQFRARSGGDTFRNCVVWNLFRDSTPGGEANGADDATVNILTYQYATAKNRQELLVAWNRFQNSTNGQAVQFKASACTCLQNTIENAGVGFSIAHRMGRESYIGGNWCAGSGRINIRGKGNKVLGNYTPNDRIQLDPGNIPVGSEGEDTWATDAPGVKGWSHAEDVACIGNTGAIVVNGQNLRWRPPLIYTPLRTLIENHTGSVNISSQARQTIDRRNQPASQVVPVAFRLLASQVGPYS
jgi:hypothetical protein